MIKKQKHIIFAIKVCFPFLHMCYGCNNLFPFSEVESHPFELDTMLFMDWRDDHTQDKPAMRDANEKLPTFLYAMPFTKNKVIWVRVKEIEHGKQPYCTGVVRCVGRLCD